ncbi:hypothetical protein DF160_02205 [Burkholderia anthina]|nr:hypothetical protein DF160_02205 [Burkholderia anthina]
MGSGCGRAIHDVGELKARQTSDDESMIFPADTASHCPAGQWVPAMLEGVWWQATSAHEQ